MISHIAREEFPQQPGLIYLNHAAVAPWPARTRTAVEEFARENAERGASRYSRWVARETALRGQLARLINAPSAADIALLKNTSEALSVVACGLPWRHGDNVVTSAEEFPSNRIPWEAQHRAGVELREVGIRGPAPEQDLMDACDANTRVLTISSVQYGSGIALDLEQMGEFCRRRGILFCVDGIQSIGAVEFDVQAIQADFVMADGHKWMLGPEGLALFYTRPSARERLTLHQFGWHMVEHAGNYDEKSWQPARSGRRFECGSSNMLGVHALSASLTLFEDAGMASIARTVRENSSYLLERLGAIDRIRLLTPARENRRAGIVTFHVDGIDTAALHARLVEQSLICACRGGGIRFSPHFYQDRVLLDQAIDLLTASI